MLTMELLVAASGFLQMVGYVLLVAGIALLVLEIFLPGIGIPGIAGLISLIVGVLCVARTAQQALVMILAVVLLGAVAFCLAIRSAHRGNLAKTPLVLKQSDDPQQGYLPGADQSGLLQARGVAVTALRPAGTALINGARVDVVTDGTFIAVDTPIRVCLVEGTRVVVEAIVQETGKEA